MSTISDDEIRRRAHQIWEREGRPTDRGEAHWRQAEEELEAEMNADLAAESKGRPPLEAPDPPPGQRPEKAKARKRPRAR